ncbi:MAG TPA: DEAD/DEAH box helicase [Candidatus Woesebacteria bacterium]|nr:DEAD/DEAH box helicase [Candidatus Woesebacteria bacterium]
MFRRSNRGNSFIRNNRFGNKFQRRSYIQQQPYEAKYIKRAKDIVEAPPYIPTKSFAEMNIHPMMKKNIAAMGYINPTPIQDGTIEHIIAGRDVIGIANTGTGKTAAFLIPLLNQMVDNPDKKTLIVVPTRELAAQIRDELRALSYGIRVYATLIIGGASMYQQISELRRNPQFVIGTPGRIKDLIEKRILNITKFNTIVLDEVDRMLDMGFIQDIRYLISLLPQQRQSLFFSATLSNEIRSLINTFVKNPITVSVKTHDTTDTVDQDVVRVKYGTPKIQILEELLHKEEFKKVLIFGKTKRGVEYLSKALYQKGFKVNSIHGDKPQAKRNMAIRLFEQNVIDILVATDVASRGIDISDITHVINYDEPATYEDYVHRIGRTGRANKKGTALTFIE